MKFDTEKTCGILTGVIFFIVGFRLVVWWLGADPTVGMREFLPGGDGRPNREELLPKVEIGRFFKNFEVSQSVAHSESWPCFRGAARDNVYHGAAKLADDWDDFPPRKQWEVPLGEGHAAPAVWNGRVFVLDYLEDAHADCLRCFTLEDGRELWRRWYDIRVKRNHGISRTVPAVADGFVVTIGPKGQVMCCRAESGDFLWGIDLARDYGAQIPGWYTGQCPLIADGVAVLAPGGPDALMMGVDCESGKVLWRAPNPEGWQMSHSSVMPMELAGRRMFVYCALGGIVGVAADGADRGSILWMTDAWSPPVVAPSPFVLPDGTIFVTAGYGAGGMLLKVAASGSGFVVDVVSSHSPKHGFASEQQTPVLFDGLMYSVLPADAGGFKRRFACVKPAEPADFIWTSGKSERFGLGPYLLADGKFYILADDGMLTMVKASTEKYLPLGRLNAIPDGRDAWGPMLVVDGKIILRDSTRMVCWDIAEVKREK